MYDDVDDDTLTRAATEALERPSNSAMWDERLYTTHAPVYSWADRGDDLIAESNFHTVLAAVRAAADDGREDTSVSDVHVIDADINDWLVGSLRQVFVQVRDEAGAFTNAWRAAVSCALAIRDYALLDEMDHGAREWERFENAYDDAAHRLSNTHLCDTDADHDAILARIDDDERGELYVGGDDPLDEDALTRAYERARGEYFDALAAPIWAAEQASARGDWPDQSALL